MVLLLLGLFALFFTIVTLLFAEDTPGVIIDSEGECDDEDEGEEDEDEDEEEYEEDSDAASGGTKTPIDS